MSPPSFKQSLHTGASPDDSGFLFLTEYILVFVTGGSSSIHSSILLVLLNGSSVSVTISTDILQFHLRQSVVLLEFQGLPLNDALVTLNLSETRRNYSCSKEASKEGGGITAGHLLTYLLTLWCGFLLEKLTGLQLVKKFPHFTEPEGSLPHSQASATCLYPGPAQSSPCTHIPLPGDPSKYYLPIYA